MMYKVLLSSNFLGIKKIGFVSERNLKLLIAWFPIKKHFISFLALQPSKKNYVSFVDVLCMESITLQYGHTYTEWSKKSS